MKLRALDHLVDFFTRCRVVNNICVSNNGLLLPNNVFTNNRKFYFTCNGKDEMQFQRINEIIIT